MSMPSCHRMCTFPWTDLVPVRPAVIETELPREAADGANIARRCSNPLCLCTLSVSLPMCADWQVETDDRPIGWLFRTSVETRVPDSHCIFVPRGRVSEHKPQPPLAPPVAVSIVKKSSSAECDLLQPQSVAGVASVSI